MSRRTEIIIAIFGVILTAITLFFGDNIYMQITGHSIAQDLRSTSDSQTTPVSVETFAQTGNVSSSSGTLLLDDFDKSNYDRKYNIALWSCFGCDEFGVVTATQGNGSIRLDATNKGNFENHSGGLVSQSSWLPNKIGYLEAKMKLLSTNNGGVHILLRGPLGEKEWSTTCWIQRFSEAQAEYACDVFTYANGQYVGEYKTESFPVKYDEWHTAKIELMPDTFKLRFYLDGELIGEHTPSDINVLKTKYLSASFGDYTDTKITAFIDDYVVTKAP